ncbi:MAG: tetratricopeptide repeat protein [Anaerolineales bacterium]|nr:tetratricopeptide repeat protein [Anaerolineales bacterium]
MAKPVSAYGFALALTTLAILLSACRLPREDPAPTAGAQIEQLNPTLTLPTATLPPPATATPPPEAETLNSEGKRALFNGDWQTSREEFRSELAANPPPDAQAESLLGIGRTFASEGDQPNALQTLRAVTVEHAGTPEEAEAYFALGQVLDSLQRYAEAAEAYQQYLTLRPRIIDAYVYEKIGDSLQNSGDLEGALAAYQNSLAGQPTGGAESLEIKIAQLYASIGDLQTAILQYQAIAAKTNSDFVKAQMDYLTGIGYRLSEQPDESIAAFQHAVDNYPQAYSAYLSLVELVELGIPVSELDRGIIDYYAGQYGVAVAAFDRYLASGQGASEGTALYYKGLSLRELGEFESALEAWDALIFDHPTSPEWSDALDAKAFTLWAWLERHSDAAQLLFDFAAEYSDHPRAPEFIFDAARIFERNGDLQKASSLWDELAVSYPDSDLAYRGLFLAGITRYRLGQHSDARVTFERTLGLAKTPDESAASNLWLGKSEEILGEPVAARAAWERASIADPTGYYSERARDLLLERHPFQPPSGYDTGIDWEVERDLAEEWLRQTYNLPPETDLTGPGPLASDPRFIRGTEFWNLGLYEEARAEFEDLRKAFSLDPESQYRLANYFVEIGLYRSAVYSSRTVLDLAGMTDATTLTAPRYFNYIRFGTYYSDLVTSAANTYSFHPLFLYSVMRQESLYEGFISSSAGARGLMQIIPSTGQYIRDLIGWPDSYSSEDLYRPNVSILFGADHLDELSTRFDFLSKPFRSPLMRWNTWVLGGAEEQVRRMGNLAPRQEHLVVAHRSDCSQERD